jgi:ABC-type dipeptide/oligopeptide/nickel transport system permease subunit
VAVKWAYYARTARAIALVERRKEYIEAATLPGPVDAAHHLPAPAAQLPDRR